MKILTTALGAAVMAGMLAAPAAARPHHYRPAPAYSNSYRYGQDYEAGYQHATIGGVVLGVRSGYVADMRLDNGQIMPVNERTLLRYGYGLMPGRHYVIYGYFGNGAFVADTLQG